MGIKTLTNEELIKIYLIAYEEKLDTDFLDLLFDEILSRDIHHLLRKSI